MHSFIRSLLPSCAVILLGGGVLAAATDGFSAFTEESARRLHVAEDRPAIPALVLEDMNGAVLNLGLVNSSGNLGANKITLVEFIYTTCPTICQTAGDDYARLRDRLVEAGLGDQAHLLSVSFDPRRDGLPEMRDYANSHGADGSIWTVARIRPGDLEKMKRSFGLRVIPDQFGGYQHNAAIHMIDKSGRLSGIFDTGDIDAALEAVRSKL